MPASITLGREHTSRVGRSLVDGEYFADVVVVGESHVFVARLTEEELEDALTALRAFRDAHERIAAGGRR